MAAPNPPRSKPDRFEQFADEHPILAFLAVVVLAAVASLLLLNQQDATIVLYENF